MKKRMVFICDSNLQSSTATPKPEFFYIRRRLREADDSLCTVNLESRVQSSSF
jgi:hypothetical protein